MAAASDYSLPGEILTEILVKLPCIKSLVRCTSVCKSWYSLIKDPYFIAHHLSYQKYMNYSRRNKYLFCAFDISDSDFDERDATDRPGEHFPYSIHYDNKAFKEYYRLEFPGGRLQSCRRRVHGCCNGLICYSSVHSASGTRSLYLWNPTIKKCKILAKIIRNPKAHLAFDFGFGFDPKLNDYKVLKIGYTRKASVVELYSLNTHSWTLITDCGPGSRYGYSPGEVLLVSSAGYSLHNIVFVNGTFYWMADRGGCRVRILVSLDVKNNTIRETKMSHSFSLRTLGDLLVVFGLSPHYKWHNVYCSDVRLYEYNFNQVLKIDDGFKELGLDREDEYLIPIGFRNNGQVLLLKNFRDYAYCTTMVSYNLKTRKAMDFGDDKYSRRPYYVQPFVESLVLLNDGDIDRMQGD